MMQIERGIFFEQNYLGVTLGGLVYSHGVIFIDAPLRPEDARAWRSALLTQRGGASRVLVNLDAHPDRTLGARALDCTIITHHKTAHVYRHRPTIFKGQMIESGAVWETYADAIGMRWAPPDITFTQKLSLFWGGPEIVLEHHPGPTPGSIWALIPAEKVVFVGDAVVQEQTPFLANADLDEWQATLELLASDYKDYKIISGRGGLAAADDLRLMQRHLKAVLKGVEKLARRNASPEDTEDLLPGLLAEFSFPEAKRELYVQRLKYGLYQYYGRRYRPSSFQDQPHIEDEEQ